MITVMSERHSPRLSRLVMSASLTVLAVAAACGGSTEPKKDVVPASITAAPTDTIRGQAGSQVNTALTVTVKNAAGQPIDSATVTFAVASGGGSLAAGAVRTDSLGRATNTWTLGQTAGVQTVTATVGALPAATFVAVASARAASAVTKIAGDAQTAIAGATVATRPSVKVADQFGNPVANTAVTFAVASGGGQVTGATANTDASGVATVGSWKLGNAVGANTLTATVQGVAPVTFTATATVGAVATLRFTNTAPVLNSGQSFTLAVQALDANNNVVANPAVTYSSSNTTVATVDQTGKVTAALGGTTTITATSGTATATQAISVLGHPSTTVVGSVLQSALIRNVAVIKDVAYTALASGTGGVGAVNLATATQAFTLVMNVPILDVAVNSANTLVTAVGGGGAPQFYFINPATQTVLDSVALAHTPVRMVMNAAGTRAIVDENDFFIEVIDIASKSVVSRAPLAGTMNVMKVAPGDTLVYAGAALGVVYELNATTGAVRRQFQNGTSIADLAVSPDGKTLFIVDGLSTSVQLIPLAAGGQTDQIGFGVNTLAGVGVTPDGLQLWTTALNQLAVAGASGGTWDTSLGGRITLNGTNLSRIFFTKLGDFAVVIDNGTASVVVFR